MRICACLFLLILNISCQSKRVVVPSPPGYDLQRPNVINLPTDLDAISGISYYNKDQSVFAISDESGYLFKITATADGAAIRKWQFARKADFEDLVLLDSTFYVLRSNGNIDIVHFEKKDSVVTSEVHFPLNGKYEFETLFYDKDKNKLFLLCKDCEGDSKQTVTSFSFDPLLKSFADSSVRIDISRLTKKGPGGGLPFKASAAAFNPVTGDLFVLSAVKKLLLVLDKNSSVKAAYPLDEGLFKQAEGITFSGSGNMIISNEATHVGAANLLVFNYKKP